MRVSSSHHVTRSIALLVLAKLDHALENLTMLRQKKIFRPKLLDGGIERVIVEQDRAEDAAFGF